MEIIGWTSRLGIALWCLLMVGGCCESRRSAGDPHTLADVIIKYGNPDTITSKSNVGMDVPVKYEIRLHFDKQQIDAFITEMAQVAFIADHMPY